MVVVVVVATTRAGARHRVPVVKDASVTLVQVLLSISSVLVAHTVGATLVIALIWLQGALARSFASVVILALVLHAHLKDQLLVLRL